MPLQTRQQTHTGEGDYRRAHVGLCDSCSLEFPNSCAGQVHVGPLKGPGNSTKPACLYPRATTEWAVIFLGKTEMIMDLFCPARPQKTTSEVKIFDKIKQLIINTQDLQIVRSLRDE